jgi:hypothetical protein
VDIVGAYRARYSEKYKMPWQHTTGVSKLRYTASDVQDTVLQLTIAPSVGRRATSPLKV